MQGMVLHLPHPLRSPLEEVTNYSLSLPHIFSVQAEKPFSRTDFFDLSILDRTTYSATINRATPFLAFLMLKN